MPHNSNSRVMFLFSYQLAHRTVQKLKSFSPVHSVGDEEPSAQYIDQKIQDVGK